MPLNQGTQFSARVLEIIIIIIVIKILEKSVKLNVHFTTTTFAKSKSNFTAGFNEANSIKEKLILIVFN